MVRPLKEGLDYFPHDTNAFNDEKIEAMRSVYKSDGYAFYFILLERIYNQGGELDVSQPEWSKVMASKCLVSEKRFLSMLDMALRWELFDKKIYEEKKILTSKGIKKRAQLVFSLREGWRKAKSATTNLQSQSNELSSEKTIQGNGKENTRKTPQITGEIEIEIESKVNNKVNNKEYSPISSEMQLSQKLKAKILENNPNARTPDSLQKWCYEFNLLLRKNGYSQEQIAQVIDFSQSSDFWKSNILSAGKLREKFDTLYLQASRGDQNKVAADDRPIKGLTVVR